MRIHDALLKCTGFISRDEHDFDYRSSAFVVSVPVDERYGVMHIVTAKHVAARLQEGKAIIGMNGRNGRPIWMRNDFQVPWFFHPDETVDVAVLPMATRWLKDYDYQDVSTKRFLRDDQVSQLGIGVGDETFNVGLFTPFIGEARFTPLVRTGVISMMPTGRIPHPQFGSMEAYLIEGRSIGGLSGSPVFVRETLNLQIGKSPEEVRLCSVLGDFYLLGLLSGHWNVATNSKTGNQDLNTGISIVVPAEKIMGALFSEELSTARSEATARGVLPTC